MAYDSQRRVREVEREAVAELTRFVWAGLRISELRRPDGTVVLRSYANDDVVMERQPSGNQLVYQYAPDAVDRGRSVSCCHPSTVSTSTQIPRMIPGRRIL